MLVLLDYNLIPVQVDNQTKVSYYLSRQAGSTLEPSQAVPSELRGKKETAWADLFSNVCGGLTTRAEVRGLLFTCQGRGERVRHIL